MLHSRALHFLVLLFVILVNIAWTTSQPFEIPTECDSNRNISYLCLQCAKRHPSNFQFMYDGCCFPDMKIRVYCEQVYTEPPKRGGIWP